MTKINNRIVAYRRTYKPKKSLRQKVYKLEKKVNSTLPEIKTNEDYADDFTIGAGTAQITDLTQIGAGTSNSQRTGNVIHVTGIDLRCHVSTQRVIQALVLAPHGTTADVLTYNTCRDGHIDQLKDEDFKELALLKNYQSTVQHVHYTRRFNPPIRVEFSTNASTTGVKNRIFLIQKNIDGLANHTGSYSYKLYFRDH